MEYKCFVIAVLVYFVTYFPSRSFQQNYVTREQINLVLIQLTQLNSTTLSLHNSLHDDIQNLTQRLTAAENDVTILRTENANLSKEVNTLKEKNNQLKTNCEISRKEIFMEINGTQNSLASFKNDTLKLEEENSNLSAELRHLQNEFNNLKKFFSPALPDFNSSSDRAFNKDQFDNLTETLHVAVKKLENETEHLRSGLVLPLWTEIAIVRQEVQKTEKQLAMCNDTTKQLQKECLSMNTTVTRLEKDMSITKSTVNQLAIEITGRKDDLMAIYNTVSEVEKKIQNLNASYADLYQINNGSFNIVLKQLANLEKKLEQNIANTSLALQSEFTTYISILRMNMTSNMTAFEVRLTGEINRLKGQNFLLGTVNTALHEVSELARHNKENISKLEGLFSSQVQIDNTRFNNISGNIVTLSEKVKLLNFNQTKAMQKLSSHFEGNISLVRNELESKVLELYKEHNSSLESIINNSKNNARQTTEMLENHNASVQSIIGNLSFIDRELDKLKDNQNKEIDELSKVFFHNISSLESVLLDKFQNLKGNTSDVVKILTNADTELQNKLLTNNKYLNSSIHDLFTELHNLQLQNQIFKNIQTLSWQQMQKELMHNISIIKIGVTDEVETMQNKCISHTLDTLQRQFNMFRANITQDIQRIERGHGNNFNDTELKNMIKHVMESHNVSIRYVMSRLDDLQTKSSDVDGNLTQAIYQLRTRTSFNMSALETRLRDALHKFVDSEYLQLRGFTNRLDTLNAAVNILATNLTHTVDKFTNNNEKVGLMACATNQQLSTGSTIHFQNIKTIYGVNDVSLFNRTGKFQSESCGLYLISAQIMSNSRGAEYAIKLNGKELSRVQITPYHDDPTNHNYHTGTGLAVVQLERNDNVWIEVFATSFSIFGKESCINIVKVK